MDVKKIFIILITIVACVVLGAFVLNILMPNVVETTIDAVEDQIFKATALSFDFNKNDHSGSVNSSYAGETDGGQDTVTTGVEGFDAGLGGGGAG